MLEEFALYPQQTPKVDREYPIRSAQFGVMGTEAGDLYSASAAQVVHECSSSRHELTHFIVPEGLSIQDLCEALGLSISAAALDCRPGRPTGSEVCGHSVFRNRINYFRGIHSSACRRG